MAVQWVWKCFGAILGDATTVEGKIAELQTQYGLKQIIFVGGRGLITRANDRQLAGVHWLQVISALSPPQMLELLQHGVIQPELFDQTQVRYWIRPDRSGGIFYVGIHTQRSNRPRHEKHCWGAAWRR